jgi:hypothetical protein
VKVRCENCPARNNRVREYALRKKGIVVAKMMLCRACFALAQKLAVAQAAADGDGAADA